jgi:hypothetical protein
MRKRAANQLRLFLQVGPIDNFAALVGAVMVLFVVSVPGKISLLKGVLILVGAMLFIVGGVHWLLGSEARAQDRLSGRTPVRRHAGLLADLPPVWRLSAFAIGVPGAVVLAESVHAAWPVKLLVAAVFTVALGCVVRLVYRASARGD